MTNDSDHTEYIEHGILFWIQQVKDISKEPIFRDRSAIKMSDSSSSNISSAGEGITGGYTGDSLTIKIFIAFFLGLAMYNVVELWVLIFGTFNRYRGLYFWSLLISSAGIVPYALGFLFKYFEILQGGGQWFSIFLLSIGWYVDASILSLMMLIFNKVSNGNWTSCRIVVETASDCCW